jgi:hypothetical protein
MTPVVRCRFFAVLKPVMLMACKKNKIITGAQIVAVLVLGDVENPFGTDNYHKSI